MIYVIYRSGKCDLLDLLHAIMRIQRHVHDVMAEALDEYGEETLHNKTLTEAYDPALKELERAVFVE